MGLFVRRTYETASFVTARRVDGVEVVASMASGSTPVATRSKLRRGDHAVAARLSS